MEINYDEKRCLKSLIVSSEELERITLLGNLRDCRTPFGSDRFFIPIDSAVEEFRRNLISEIKRSEIVNIAQVVTETKPVSQKEEEACLKEIDNETSVRSCVEEIDSQLSSVVSDKAILNPDNKSVESVSVAQPIKENLITETVSGASTDLSINKKTNENIITFDVDGIKLVFDFNRYDYYYYQSNGAVAYSYKGDHKYTNSPLNVMKGSMAKFREVYNHSFTKYLPVQKELINDGVLKKIGKSYYFTKEHRFNSFSQAACIIDANSRDGRVGKGVLIILTPERKKLERIIYSLIWSIKLIEREDVQNVH